MHAHEIAQAPDVGACRLCEALVIYDQLGPAGREMRRRRQGPWGAIEYRREHFSLFEQHADGIHVHHADNNGLLYSRLSEEAALCA